MGNGPQQARYKALFQHLDERQRRLVAAADAEQYGRGGISVIARSSGLSRPTIHKALRELHKKPLPPGRQRRAGGGRKALETIDPSIVEQLDLLIDPATRGDPMSPLRWTSKSTRHLAAALEKAGHRVSHETVAHLLHQHGYSLQGTSKTLEGTQHPDRNAQFEYISRQSARFLHEGWPVVSVDAKKKEPLGKYRNSGREWRPHGQPEPVLIYDFIDPDVGKAILYGLYDVRHDSGWVSVGTDHDTASFAVESIRRWWRTMGSASYPKAMKLLICADGGGSNSNRSRLWKTELQHFATQYSLEITVCHFPPGTSKWNKIEHRLFSHITMNWRGRPLVSHDVVVSLIGATATNSGLRIKTILDKKKYPLGIHVSDEAMAELHLFPHKFHGEWNYTLNP